MPLEAPPKCQEPSLGSDPLLLVLCVDRIPVSEASGESSGLLLAL